jgi:DNA-binding response OmpR family regulator
MIQDITPATPNPPNNPVPSPEVPATPTKRILCIEDEPFIGDLYKRAFEKAGYYAEIITDGTAGLERARSDEFDIILLDIMIPQILGIDVLHELRKVPKRLKAKIIIATNLEQDDETREKIEQEADAYLIKAEITPTELVQFLKNF